MCRVDRRVDRCEETLGDGFIVSRPPISDLRVEGRPQACPWGRPRGCLGGDGPQNCITGGSIGSYIVTSSLFKLLLSSFIFS